jgi:hypothetical protein
MPVFSFSMPSRLAPLVDRRRVLVAGSACAASLVPPNALAQAGGCVVTPDSGEGPFYFDPSLPRSDVTSGRMGAPRWVRFKTVYPSWYGGRTPHLHFKVFVDSKEVIATQIFFDDEVNAEIFNNWDPYREHVRKRTSFNNNDTFLDRDKDGRADGLFCEVERYDRGSGVTAKAVVTVDAWRITIPRRRRVRM